MKFELYRASINNKIGMEETQYCMGSKEVAEAYLGTGGFGGPSLYKFEIEIDAAKVLDLGDSRIESIEALYQEIKEIDEDIADSIDWTEINWAYEAIFNFDLYDELKAAGYDLIIYPDEYPEEATCYCWIGEMIEGEKI